MRDELRNKAMKWADKNLHVGRGVVDGYLRNMKDFMKQQQTHQSKPTNTMFDRSRNRWLE